MSRSPHPAPSFGAWPFWLRLMLAPYASHRFLYDGAGRVTEETVRGGEAVHGFAWMTRSTDPGFDAVNEWYRRGGEAPDEDALWRGYYKSIFNPARLKVKAMQAEMPKKLPRDYRSSRRARKLKLKSGRSRNGSNVGCRQGVIKVGWRS